MKLNWLEDIDVNEISYVDRPAIDKRFIAIKRLEEESPKEGAKPSKSFIDRIKESFSNGSKVGRVLNKSNEDKLSEVADMLKNASEYIVSVLSAVNKNAKEDENMEKDELKILMKEVISEEIGTLKTELDAKYAPKIDEKEDANKPEDKKSEVEDKIDVAKIVEDAVNKASEKFTTEVKSLRDEMHAKPESDKKDINNGEQKKNDNEESDDFTGAFNLKMF